MEEKIRKKFTYASFTWNGDSFEGTRFAKQMNRKMKNFIRTEIAHALAEREEEILRLFRKRLGEVLQRHTAKGMIDPDGIYSDLAQLYDFLHRENILSPKENL